MLNINENTYIYYKYIKNEIDDGFGNFTTDIGESSSLRFGNTLHIAYYEYIYLNNFNLFHFVPEYLMAPENNIYLISYKYMSNYSNKLKLLNSDVNNNIFSLYPGIKGARQQLLTMNKDVLVKLPKDVQLESFDLDLNIMIQTISGNFTDRIKQMLYNIFQIYKIDTRELGEFNIEYIITKLDKIRMPKVHSMKDLKIKKFKIFIDIIVLLYLTGLYEHSQDTDKSALVKCASGSLGLGINIISQNLINKMIEGRIKYNKKILESVHDRFYSTVSKDDTLIELFTDDHINLPNLIKQIVEFTGTNINLRLIIQQLSRVAQCDITFDNDATDCLRGTDKQINHSMSGSVDEQCNTAPEEFVNTNNYVDLLKPGTFEIQPELSAHPARPPKKLLCFRKAPFKARIWISIGRLNNIIYSIIPEYANFEYILPFDDDHLTTDVFTNDDCPRQSGGSSHYKAGINRYVSNNLSGLPGYWANNVMKPRLLLDHDNTANCYRKYFLNSNQLINLQKNVFKFFTDAHSFSTTLENNSFGLYAVDVLCSDESDENGIKIIDINNSGAFMDIRIQYIPLLVMHYNSADTEWFLKLPGLDKIASTEIYATREHLSNIHTHINAPDLNIDFLSKFNIKRSDGSDESPFLQIMFKYFTNPADGNLDSFTIEPTEFNDKIYNPHIYTYIINVIYYVYKNIKKLAEKQQWRIYRTKIKSIVKLFSYNIHRIDNDSNSYLYRNLHSRHFLISLYTMSPLDIIDSLFDNLSRSDTGFQLIPNIEGILNPFDSPFDEAENLDEEGDNDIQDTQDENYIRKEDEEARQDETVHNIINTQQQPDIELENDLTDDIPTFNLGDEYHNPDFAGAADMSDFAGADANTNEMYEKKYLKYKMKYLKLKENKK